MTHYDTSNALPAGGEGGTWAGRAWLPASTAANGIAGPRVISVRDGEVYDLGDSFPTFSGLVNSDDPAGGIRAALARGARRIGSVAELLTNSLHYNRAARLAHESKPVLLAPNDLLATKACGVTFIKSLLERVVEEKARGDAETAAQVRRIILESLGEDLSQVKPGSPETVELKKRLIAEGVWSQYLEVGIGPDAEVFTKAQPMASVGYGAQVGILPRSNWNNPEPEIVLAISCRGEIVGATLGNDVNLRDFEGRSALLLGEAKDQNGSCAIGPMVRFFDGSFRLEDVENCEVSLRITGEDGVTTGGANRMAEISRSPRELAAQAIGKHHQYPDGLVLFLGTMFAPTTDRDAPGQGFTHHIGDCVEISTPQLGTLVNWVNHTDKIPKWDYGIGDMIQFLMQSRS